MKKLLSLLLLTVLLCGCGIGEDLQSGEPEPQVVLEYYTIGGNDPDLSLVGEELNRLMVSRYGFGVHYRRLDFNDYVDATTTMINTGASYDVMFTWGSHYVKHAENGAFLNLDPYLQKEAYSLYYAVDPRLWQGCKIGGSVFGVPTNKELGPVVQLLFSRELAEKYALDVSSCRSLRDLEPMLRLIKEKEPEAIPLLFTSERLNLTEYAGYEYVAGEDLPFVIRQDDPECRVVNLYETPEMRELQDTLRRYFTRGYVNPDAAIRSSGTWFPDEKVFCRIGIGGPAAEQSFSVDGGYPVIAVKIGTPRVTNLSARGALMAINGKTRHPKEALTFLTAVNLDPEVRNLLNYGLEGVHYNITDQNQVHVISDGYRGVPYTQGNWFILKTMEGEAPDKWDQYREYNENAESSLLLGFEPDLQELSAKAAGVSRAYVRFDNALLTGSVEPERFRNVALNHMYQAGEDSVRQELQRQIDSWLGLSQEKERNE